MSLAEIVAIGALTPNGLDARQAVFFTRAGRLFVRESPFVDRRGAPVGLASVLAVPDDVRGPARLLALAAPALRECLTNQPSIGPGTVPLLLALPGDAAQAAPGLGGSTAGQALNRELLARLANEVDDRLDVGRSIVARFGRAGGALALSVALSRLRQRQVPFVLVGGVDSFHDADRLDALDAAHRLHAEDVENGTLPGEGAAFVLLAPAGTGGSLASLRSLAIENEPRSLEAGTDEPCQALALTLAMRRALDDAQLPRIERLVSDVVEERHRVHEQLLASGRLAARIGGSPLHEQPLLTTGELGAATVPFLVAYVAGLFRARAADAARLPALVVATSDGEPRAALVLTPPGAGS